MIGRVLLTTLFSADGVFFAVVPIKGVDEFSKGSSSLHQLLVGAGLRHPTILHHQDQVGLGQEAEPVSHQHPSLSSQGSQRRHKPGKRKAKIQTGFIYINTHNSWNSYFCFRRQHFTVRRVNSMSLAWSYVSNLIRFEACLVNKMCRGCVLIYHWWKKVLQILKIWWKCSCVYYRLWWDKNYVLCFVLLLFSFFL